MSPGDLAPPARAAATVVAALRAEVRRDATRGAWQGRGIDARFSFDFGAWQAPGRAGFGVLKVLNEDRIAPGSGFPMHPHADLEILMLPLAGAIAHEDSLGNRFTVEPDEVAFMRAGSGIRHSQFNALPVEVDHHLQLWIAPRTLGLAPLAAKRRFDRAARIGRWQAVASGDGRDGSLRIDQDATVLRARLENDAPLAWDSHAARRLYLHLVSGEVHVATLSGLERLVAGDALAVSEGFPLWLSRAGEPPAEVLLVDLPR